MSHRPQHPPRGSSNHQNGGGGGGYYQDDRNQSYGGGRYDDRNDRGYANGYSQGDRGYGGGGNGNGYSQNNYANEGRYPDSRGNAPAPAGSSSSKWAAAAQAAETQNKSGYASSGYKGWENVDNETENYDDEGWLARKTKKTQNDSLESSRKALAKLQQSESVAASSLNKLNNQSEQLYKIENKLDTAENKSKISEAKASELRSLNRFFMIPAFGAKRAKRLEEKYKSEEELAAQKEAERRERIQNVIDSGNGAYGHHQRFEEDGREKREGRPSKKNQKEQMDHWSHEKSYSTPEGLERDETEEEIDNNLDQISSGLARLRMMGRTMNSELDHQNGHINRIADKTDGVRDRVDRTTEKVTRMVKRK
ncbi:hypothetical protein HDU67_009253 [Dinochytrium kinnereticum]|nr:hypothetical protein HDU67_009253 [Dinochytrium kinnereticum]